MPHCGTTSGNPTSSARRACRRSDGPNSGLECRNRSTHGDAASRVRNGKNSLNIRNQSLYPGVVPARRGLDVGHCVSVFRAGPTAAILDAWRVNTTFHRRAACGSCAGEVIPLYGIDPQNQGPPGIAFSRDSRARSPTCPWKNSGKIARNMPEGAAILRVLPTRRNRPFALDGGAMHEAAGAVIVVDGVVHGAAVVPDRQVVGAPAQAAGELGPDGVIEEELEQRPALRLGHA